MARSKNRGQTAPAGSQYDPAGILSEQGHLVGVFRRWSLGAQHPVDRGERFDLAGLYGDLFGQAERTADRVEGVADVPELGVELVVVAIEEVLQALERKRPAELSITHKILPFAAKRALICKRMGS